MVNYTKVMNIVLTVIAGDRMFQERHIEVTFTWSKILTILSIAVIILGGVAWLTKIEYTASANYRSLNQLKSDRQNRAERIYDRINDLDQKVSKILGMLEVMEESVGRRKK